MPKKKDNPQVSIRVGNISGVKGEVNIAGRDVTTNKTSNSGNVEDIDRLFDQFYAAIEASAQTPRAKKEDVKAEVKEIQSSVTEAAQNHENVDEGFLVRRFRNIARMAPDILDVVLATLGNPLAGYAVAVKKIAEKVKEETK